MIWEQPPTSCLQHLCSNAMIWGFPNRSFMGQLTPERVKGIHRPAALRFEVKVVPIEGTKRTAAILKDKVEEIPKKLWPIIERLRELEGEDEITKTNLNKYFDEMSKATQDQKGSYRGRYLKKLLA